MNRSLNAIRLTVMISIVALVALTASLPFANRASALPEGLLPHGPILIDGDAGFTPANGVTSGSGTAGDPYVIKGWNIDASSANGIGIRNTSVHFVIRNCYVHDGRDNYKHGIYFENVKNWKIDDVTSTNNFDGIFLVYSSDGVVDNCISDNNLGKGIWLWYSLNNIVINCAARNNNFEDIHLWNSDNNTVENCILEGDDHGITIDSAENNTVTNCSVENNNFGIYFNLSTCNVVTNCIVRGNNFGIAVVSSNNNIITRSIIENNNLGYTIHDNSENNHIYHNDFINNAQQGLDYHTNYWDNGYPSGGNYWSDYNGADNYRGEDQDISGSDNIGDTPYFIPGGTNRDRYPFMNPIAKAPGPSPEVPSRPPWGLIIGIVIVATAVIGTVVWRMLNLKKERR